MGSAQSARRIQPGGGSGRVGGPADLSRPPFLPTPPPALPPPPPLLLLPGGGGLRRVRGWAGGAGGGVGGGPSPDRRPAAAGRISTAAVRRDRLRDGWEGPVGKVARGAPSRPVFPPARVLPREGAGRGGGGGGGGTTPRVLQPPGSSTRRIPGPRERDPSPRSPPSRRPPPRGPPARGSPPRGRAGVPRGGPGHPSHGATALPPPPRNPGDGGPRGWGRGGLSPVRPGRVAPSGPGGFSRGHARVPRRGGRRSERTGSAAMSATHPTRLETRTKESNTCASQGLARKPPWRNEGEGRRARRPRWDPEASPVRRGRTTGPSRPPRRGGGARAHVLGPERW